MNGTLNVKDATIYDLINLVARKMARRYGSAGSLALHSADISRHIKQFYPI